MSEAFEVVCRFDEAIDPEAQTEEQRLSFATTYSPKDLAYLPGEVPTVFHCKRLAVSDMRAVLSHPEPMQPWAAFVRGLVSVTDMRCDDGARRTWTRPTEKPLTDEVVTKAGFSITEVNEVGEAIMGRSRVGKGRPAVWRLPATSRDALEALARLRVAQMARDSARSKAQRASEQGQPSASDGETPGAATATASAEERR